MQLRRHLTPVVLGAALVAALTGIGVAAAVDSDPGGDGDGGTVVNKNGHEVNEHARFGQETAEEARSKHGEKSRGGERKGHGQGHGHAFGHLSPAQKEQAKAAWKAEHPDDAEDDRSR